MAASAVAEDAQSIYYISNWFYYKNLSYYNHLVMVSGELCRFCAVINVVNTGWIFAQPAYDRS